MDAVSSILATSNAVKAALLTIAGLGLTAYKYPASIQVEDGATYDYVVVGAGTAGCILLNRLTELPDVEVLGIEAGGDPPFEAEIPPLFPFTSKTYMDWNYIADDDGYTAQYRRTKNLDLPSGKVLGGSGILGHFYLVRGDASDYDAWVLATGDESWSFENLLHYFKKSEKYQGKDVTQDDILNYHGTDGYVGITKEDRELPSKYLSAFAEVGNDIVNNVNTGKALGFTRPMYSISKEGIRQSTADTFLSPVKDRKNLHLLKNTKVIKVLIDDSKRAIGVLCLGSDGKTFNVYATKEVILSSGALNSPLTLQSSGIGPASFLDAMEIPVIADLPVGDNLQDHMAVILAHKMEATDEAAPTNARKFPIESFIGFGALDKNKAKPDYLTLNLICRNSPAALMQLSTLVFGLHEDVCEQLYKAGDGNEVLFTVLTKGRPLSHGTVRIKSLDPSEPPKIKTGFLSDKTDLEDSAAYIQDFIKVTESTYFKDVGGETLRFNWPNCKHLEWNTKEYWKCYILNMMDTTFHYSGTCAMGTVLDSKLRVRGIKNLRVVDASSMPSITSGNINAAVMVIAEKAADLIKDDFVKEDATHLFDVDKGTN